MGRRVARQRLYELNKEGETLTSTAGAGIEGNIGAQSRLREGELITTDITIDLGSSAGAASSFATSGPSAAGTHAAIGISSSTGTHSNANLMLINATASGADAIGLVVSAELICVETPAGGEDKIGLWYGTNASGSGALMDSGGVELIAAQDMAVGKDAISSDLDSAAAGLDNKYLYLVSSGSAGAYTAGKFVLRLHGYNVFDDV